MLLKTTMNLTDNGPEYSIQKPDGTVVAIQGGTLGTDGSVTVGPANAGSNLTVSVELADLFVEHTMGNRISSLVANTADNQVISNQVTVNLQLNNVNPLALGSAGFQIEALGVDAASFRVP
jgi:copper oxidase (laccase) domain-containing protein